MLHAFNSADLLGIAAMVAADKARLAHQTPPDRRCAGGDFLATKRLTSGAQ
jgi:hypothetical protein